MKNLLKIISASGVLLFLLFLNISCEIETATLESFEIDSSTIKKEWLETEILDLTGLKVSARYSDGSVEPIKDYFTSPENGTLCKDIPWSSYYDKTDSTKYSGEIFILSKTIKTSHELCMKDGTSFYVLGTIPITIIYNNVCQIEVDTSNVKLNYGVNEKLDFTGLKVKATYADGNTEYVEKYCEISYPSTMCDGTFPVNVNYFNGSSYVSTVFYINVFSVERLEVDSSAVKTTYFSGEYFDIEGLKVYAIYSNGERKELNTSQFMISNLQIYDGENKIYIYFADKSVSINVKGEPVVSKYLKLNTESMKTEYYEGDKLNLQNLKVTLVYNNGLESNIYYDSCSFYMQNNLINQYNTILNSSGEQELTAMYDGVEGKFSIFVNPLILEHIELDTEYVKKEYFVGDNFKSSYLKVYGVYNGGKKEISAADYTISSGTSTFDTAGEQEITVSFGEKTASFKVNVTDVTVSYLELERDMLVTTGYYIGDSPYKYSGLIVKAHYNNNDVKTLDYYSYDISPTRFMTKGENTVTITYGGKQVSYTVNVDEVTLSYIYATPPNKTNYFVGDKLDFSGLLLNAVFNNGTMKPVDYTSDIADGTILDTAGKKEITLYYGGKNTTITINVSEVVVTEIKLNTKDLKTNGYYTGDKLNLSGLKVIAYFNNGSNNEINEYTTSIPDGAVLDSNGKKEIIVSYSGKTALFYINVDTLILNWIDIDYNDIKTRYFVGDKLDLTGLKVFANYNSGKIEVNDYEIDISDGAVLETEGYNTISISYGGKTSSFNIYVAEIRIDYLELDTTTVKKEGYYTGDKLDLSGLKVYVHYNNGKITKVEDYTTSIANGEILDDAGNKQITVEYQEVKVSFNIEVVKYCVTELKLDISSVKTEGYYTGDKLDLSGLKVTAIYNNGDEIVVTNYGKNISDGDILTSSGLHKIEIHYDSVYAYFNISVTQLQITSLELDTSSLKSTVFSNQKDFNTDGLIVTAVYNNGTSKIVDKYTTIIQNCEKTDSSLKGGYREVVVKYEESTSYLKQEIEASYEIFLQYLERIDLDTSKVKKSGYYTGDKLILNGINVKKVFSSGSTLDVTYDLLKMNGEILDSSALCVSVYFTPRILNTAGQVEIKIFDYGAKGEVSASFYVNVTKTLPTLSMNTTSVKKQYFTGDNLDLSGLKVYAKYRNGDPKLISDSDYTTTPANNSILTKEGVNKIEISYDGSTTSFSIDVTKLALDSMTIDTSNIKNKYYLGEIFTLEGLSISSKYNNGEIIPVSEYESSLSPGTKLLKTGKQNITISAAGETKVFEIEVLNNLQSVKISVPDYTDKQDLLTHENGIFRANENYSNYLWMLDGSVVTESSNIYIPDQTKMKAGTHEILLLVTNSAGKRYSATANFVINK